VANSVGRGPNNLRLAAFIIGCGVAVKEGLYYIEHTRRPGPAAAIFLLGVAVALLAAADIRTKGGAA
jgi:hypothetical protein